MGLRFSFLTGQGTGSRSGKKIKPQGKRQRQSIAANRRRHECPQNRNPDLIISSTRTDASDITMRECGQDPLRTFFAYTSVRTNDRRSLFRQ